MAVRNFWIEADIEGRQTNPAGGPVRRDGGMDVTIYQRFDGCIETAVRIVCRAYGEKLITKVSIAGKDVGEYVSYR